MKQVSKLAVAVVASAMLLGCGGVSTGGTDASGGGADAISLPNDATSPTGDGSLADAVSPSDAAMTPTAPSAIASTSGGGAAVSANYQVQLRIGAPSPMGNASSASFSARLGPPSR